LGAFLKLSSIEEMDMRQGLVNIAMIAILSMSNSALAGPTCSPDSSIIDSMNVIRTTFMKSSHLTISQSVSGLDGIDKYEKLTSSYTIDFVDLDKSDFLIKSNSDKNNPPPFHGSVKNIYVGLDIRNNEIDLLFFRTGMGTDERLFASFKVQESDSQCVLKTKHYQDKYYAQLTIDSWSSLRVEYYFVESGQLDESNQNYFFQ
jgi:hypothetical protein